MLLVVPAAAAWRLLLLLAVQVAVAAGVPQPWRCAPCSAEKLALCPPVPASCPEVARPAGCGCCPTCALQLGAACGVATARCARGLSCRALPGESRPLHALTRGQGACVPEPDASAPSTPKAKSPAAPENVSPESTEMTEEQLLENFHLMAPSSEDRPILWNAISTYESMRARDVANIQKWKCETSMDGEAGLCWCVYPWSGKKIPGSLEVRGDPNCHQYFNLQN
uniref:Insulin-like growth factor-binding protein 1 n=1 Tax=Prolemur simus TaxID=1328070 RepID=A0A8C9AJN8_PROSS